MRSLEAPSAAMIDAALRTGARAPLVTEDPPRFARPAVAGDYELLQCIGRGKTGAVWRARHPRLGRDVAIKLLSDDVEHDEAARRLAREANLAGRVTSDAVAQIYDVGRSASGRPYLVMQLIEGQPLARIVARRRPLGVERSVRLVRHVGRALHEVHASRVVHGDLKAGDIFVTKAHGAATRVKIVDFGDGDTLDGLREVGALAPIDAQTDVLALAILAYRCLTGRTPHVARDLRGVVVAPSSTPTPRRPSPLASYFDAAIPRGVDSVLARALGADARDRFESARELSEALAAAVGRTQRAVVGQRHVPVRASNERTDAVPSSAPPGARPAPPGAAARGAHPDPARRPRVAVAAVTVALLSAALAVHAWQSRPSAVEPCAIGAVGSR